MTISEVRDFCEASFSRRYTEDAQLAIIYQLNSVHPHCKTMLSLHSISDISYVGLRLRFWFVSHSIHMFVFATKGWCRTQGDKRRIGVTKDKICKTHVRIWRVRLLAKAGLVTSWPEPDLPHGAEGSHDLISAKIPEKLSIFSRPTYRRSCRSYLGQNTGEVVDLISAKKRSLFLCPVFV